MLAEGYIGAPDETTIVCEKPKTAKPEQPEPKTAKPKNPKPEQPELKKPEKLPETDGGLRLLPLGAAGVLLVGTGLTFWFGRRLAPYRERNGYVRDENLMSGEEFKALFKE